MIERERTMASMDFTSRHGTKEDGANKLDIDMLVKLTTRLQKASHTYESLRGDMDKIKEVLALFVLFYFTGMLYTLFQNGLYPVKTGASCTKTRL